MRVHSCGMQTQKPRIRINEDQLFESSLALPKPTKVPPSKAFAAERDQGARRENECT
jgi:hypothetical protein